MPNAKIYVDAGLPAGDQARLATLMPELRDMLCAALSVDYAACQFALLPVTGLPDQPAVNVELSILPRPTRTRETLTATAHGVRDLLAAPGVSVAVRIMHLDPETYVALK